MHFNVFAMAEYKIVMIGVCVFRNMCVHVCVCVFFQEQLYKDLETIMILS